MTSFLALLVVLAAYARPAVPPDEPPMRSYTRELFDALAHGRNTRARELVRAEPHRARRFAYDRLEQRDTRGLEIGLRAAALLGDADVTHAITVFRELGPAERRALLSLPTEEESLREVVERCSRSTIPYLEARARRELAVRLHTAGSNTRALDEIERVVELDRRLDEAISLAFDLSTTARIRQALFLPREAYEAVEEALAVANEIGETGLARELVEAAGDLAAILGRYGDAIRHRQRAVDLAPDPRRRARAMTRLGGTHSEVGLFTEAERELLDAVSLLRTSGGSPADLTAALVALGLARLDASAGTRTSPDPAERATEALRALDEARTRVGESAAGQAILADAELHRGSALLALGRSAEAVEAYRASVSLRDPDAPSFGLALGWIGAGDALAASGCADEAESAYRRGIEVAEALPGLDLAWRARAGLGRLAELDGRDDDALSLYLRAIEDLEHLRRLLVAPSLRARSVTTRSDVVRRAARLLARRGRLAESFAMAERVQARTLLELGAGAGRPAPGPSRERDDDLDPLREELLRVEERLAAIEATAPGDRSASHAALVENARSRHRRLCLMLEIEAFREAALSGLAVAPPLDSIRAALAPGEALVEYVSADDFTCAWVVRRERVAFFELDVERPRLESRIDSIVDPFLDLRDGSLDIYHLSFDVRSARDLQQRLVEPLLRALEACDVLWIVPDGRLRGLPFALLVTEHEKRRVDPETVYAQYEGCEFLVEDFAIGYLPTAGLLHPRGGAGERNGDREPELSAKGPAVVLGDPRPHPAGARPLRHARSEVGEIGARLAGSVTRAGSAATRDALLGLAPRPTVLHVAAHAELDDRRPSYSRLALAGSWVHAWEIARADFAGTHVVLSACDTVGDTRSGEGFLGLARAFLEAGAHSVVATAWSVDDASTSRLMRDYHEARSSIGSSVRALRSAQLAMIREGERPGLRLVHPFFWAGFQHLGPDAR